MLVDNQKKKETEGKKKPLKEDEKKKIKSHCLLNKQKDQ